MEKRKERAVKNREFWAALILIIALVFFLLTFYFKSVSGVLSEKHIDVRFEVSNVTGLKVGSDLLDFGRIIQGSSGSKTIVLSNSYTFPINVEFQATGNVSDFLVYNKNVFLEPNETKSVSISTIVFSNESFGNYSGVLHVKFVRATEEQ